MTGVLQCLMSSGGSVVINSNNYSDSYLGVATNPAINLQTNGTTTRGNASATTNWATPTTTGIGANYWLKLVLGAGNGTATGTSSALGVWLSLSASSQGYGILAAPAGQVRTRALTYQLSSDSGGSVIVGSGSIQLESDRS